MPCFVHFFRFWQCKNYWNRLRLDRVAVNVHCYVLWIRKKCRFYFFQVRCAHKSGDVISLIIVACRISSWLKWYKNYKNRLTLAKVIVKNTSRFFMVHCVNASWLLTTHSIQSLLLLLCSMPSAQPYFGIYGLDISNHIIIKCCINSPYLLYLTCMCTCWIWSYLWTYILNKSKTSMTGSFLFFCF